MPLPVSQACFRLLGETEGGRLSFVLSTGEHTVGTDPACSVVLPVRGVSRRHARLSVADAGVHLADLESKNGSFLNGRDGHGQLALIGDELRFGPVTLRLQGADPEEAALGLVLDPGLAPEVPSLETTWLGAAGETPAAASLEGLDAVLSRLLDLPEPDLPGALAAFATHRGAAGAAMVEWHGSGTSVALATAGNLGIVPDLGELPVAPTGDWQVLPRRPDGSTRDPSQNRPPDLSPDRRPDLLVMRRSGKTATGLLLWGERGRRPASRELLVGVARLLAHFEPRAAVPLDSVGPSERAEIHLPGDMVRGRSPAMTALYQQMALLLQGDVPVLILGETGVGKEHLALALHGSGSRRDGPFIAVNCAAIPKELLEAEMFGIGKGVATGVEPRRGKFAEAEGGTLFLDEIGEMPAELQAKLLRVLQEKEIHPLGRSPRPTDVRVLAATNVDLRRLRAGGFRRDLYYRLAGYVLDVPALRNRADDIPLLIDHFLRRFCHETGKPVRGVTVKALRLLTSYPWPGNVRELEHEIRRLVFLCPPHRVVEAEMISGHITTPATEETTEEPTPHEAAQRPPAQTSSGQEPSEENTPELPARAAPILSDLHIDGLDGHLKNLERHFLELALRRAAGNQSAAARLLRISRNGLAKRVKRLGIDVSRFLPE